MTNLIRIFDDLDCKMRCLPLENISRNKRLSNETRMLNDESGDAIYSELKATKNRNSRLIEQLREKSMERSKLASQVDTLHKQVNSIVNENNYKRNLLNIIF